MRVLLIILGAVFLFSMLGGVGAVMRVMTAKARRKLEDEQREADELVRRWDERVAQREQAALAPTADPGTVAPNPLPSAKSPESQPRQE